MQSEKHSLPRTPRTPPENVILTSKRLRLWTLCVAGFAALCGCSSRETRVVEHLARAESLMESGAFEKAKAEFEDAFGLDPENWDAANGLARVGERQGRIRLAYQALDLLKELDQDNPETRSRLALVYLQAGQLEQARIEAEFALRKIPSDPATLFRFADSTDGTPASAKSAIETLKSLDLPEDYAPLDAAYGIIFSKLASYQDRAERFLRKSLAREPENSEALLKLAKLLWRQSQLEQAEAAFAQAVEHAPQDPAFALEYAHFKSVQNESAAAVEILANSLDLVPEHLPSLIELSRLHFDAKRYDDAAPLVERILTIDDSHPSGLQMKAKRQRSLHQPTEAIATLERAARIYPLSASTQLELGLAYLAVNDPQKAVACLHKARSLGSESSEINILLAGANLAQEDFSGAILEIRDFLQNHPDDENVRTFLAETYFQKSDFDRALEIYQSLAERFPDKPELPFKIGLAQLQQRNPAEARAAFERSYAVSKGTYFPALEQLVLIDLSQRAFAKARQRIDAYEAKSQPSADSAFLRSVAFHAADDLDSAQTNAQIAIALDPEKLDAYFLSAQIARKRDDPELASQQLSSIVERDPGNVRALMSLGDLREQSGKFQEAANFYQKALDADPRNAPAMNNLAYLLSKNPATLDQAYALANRARQIHPNDPIIADTLGWIVYQRSNYSWAAPILEEAANRLPNRPEPNYHFAKALYAMGDSTRAQASFEKALAASSAFHEKDDCLLRLEIIALAHADLDDAGAERLQRHLEQDPTDPIALLSLAKHAAANSRLDQAKTLLQRAIQSNPENGYAKIQLASVYRESGDTRSAFATAKEAYNLLPGNPELHRLLGILAYEETQYAWSNALLTRAANAFAQDKELLFWLARSHLAVGKLAESVQAAQSAAQLDPGDLDLQRFLTLSKVLEGGKTSEATTQLAQEALTDDPRHLPALLYLARLQETDTDAAIARYREILLAYKDCFIAQREIALLEAVAKATAEEETSL